MRSIIPTLILAIANGYLCISLFGTAYDEARPLFWSGILGIQAIFASQLWLFYLFFNSKAETKLRFEKPIQTFAFHSMGLFSFLFVFTVLRDLAAMLGWVFRMDYEFHNLQTSWIILAASFVSYALGALNARFRIKSPYVEIPVPQLPHSMRGLKIVQLSDIHLGTGPKTAHVSAMVDRALSLKPDLIALTGDIIDGMVDEMKPELTELARLKAPLGVYFVLGNHECYWKREDAIIAMKKMKFHVLQNEGREVTVATRGGQTESLFVAGMNDPAITHFPGGKDQGPKLTPPPPRSSFNLMLVHQPQFAEKISSYRGSAPNQYYHLQLSGHTHGGQFFPWNLVVRYLYPIHGGLGRVNDLYVYVSHGSGYWGPPVRLGTDGEVTEIVLKNG